MNKRQRNKLEKKRLSEIFFTGHGVVNYKEQLELITKVTRKVPAYANQRLKYATTSTKEERQKLQYDIIKLGGRMDAAYARVVNPGYSKLTVGKVYLVDISKGSSDNLYPHTAITHLWLLDEEKESMYESGLEGRRSWYVGKLIEIADLEVVYDPGLSNE